MRKHGSEEARLLLEARAQSRRALVLAEQNLAQQHEPWDARLLLEAALAIGSPEAARPALAWLCETGFEAPWLTALRARLGAVP